MGSVTKQRALEIAEQLAVCPAQLNETEQALIVLARSHINDARTDRLPAERDVYELFPCIRSR